MGKEKQDGTVIEWSQKLQEDYKIMRSDNVKTGMQQAPHRSLFNALGLTKEELERPLVGIVCSYNEIVPGHMNLDKIANAVKMGVAMAGSGSAGDCR